MPTVSIFYGILIHMYWDEHSPPHFHALYAEYEASIEIATRAVIRGSLPKRALTMVKEWTALHEKELMEDWNLCASGQPPKKISPLR